MKSNNKVFPTPCKAPKMHKSPIGTRFITATQQRVIQHLSKNITTEFQLLYKFVEKYNENYFSPQSQLILGDSKQQISY